MSTELNKVKLAIEKYLGEYSGLLNKIRQSKITPQDFEAFRPERENAEKKKYEDEQSIMLTELTAKVDRYAKLIKNWMNSKGLWSPEFEKMYKDAEDQGPQNRFKSINELYDKAQAEQSASASSSASPEPKEPQSPLLTQFQGRENPKDTKGRQDTPSPYRRR